MTTESLSADEADATYVQLAHGTVARTIELDEGTLVDVAADGTALGVEVIHPAREWPVQEIIDRFHPTAEQVALLKASEHDHRHVPEATP